MLDDYRTTAQTYQYQLEEARHDLEVYEQQPWYQRAWTELRDPGHHQHLVDHIRYHWHAAEAAQAVYRPAYERETQLEIELDNAHKAIKSLGHDPAVAIMRMHEQKAEQYESPKAVKAWEGYCVDQGIVEPDSARLHKERTQFIRSYMGAEEENRQDMVETERETRRYEATPYDRHYERMLVKRAATHYERAHDNPNQTCELDLSDRQATRKLAKDTGYEW